MIYGKFIGKDSCGFKRDKTYKLRSVIRPHHTKLLFGKKKYWIWLYDVNSNAKCPYESIEAINKNWEIKYNES